MEIVAVPYPGDAAGNPEVLGCAENALGLGDSLGDEHGLVSTTFWPVYVTEEMPDEAENLKLILAAGVGSEHIDLGEAAERGTTVAEITGSDTVSVAEHAVMQILALVRNFVPAYKVVVDGGWSIGEIAAGSHDLERKTVGVYGAGRIGQLIAAHLKLFDVETLCYERSRLGTTEELSLGMRYATLDEMLEECDVIVIAPPLTPETRGLFDRETLFGTKEGAHLVNIARDTTVEGDALVEALEAGHLGSYAAGVRDSLENFVQGQPVRDDYVMVSDGEAQSGSYGAIYGQSISARQHDSARFAGPRSQPVRSSCARSDRTHRPGSRLRC